MPHALQSERPVFEPRGLADSVSATVPGCFHEDATTASGDATNRRGKMAHVGRSAETCSESTCRLGEFPTFCEGLMRPPRDRQSAVPTNAGHEAGSGSLEPGGLRWPVGKFASTRQLPEGIQPTAATASAMPSGTRVWGGRRPPFSASRVRDVNPGPPPPSCFPVSFPPAWKPEGHDQGPTASLSGGPA